MDKNKLSLKVIWGYGFGSLAESLCLNLYYIYFIFFLTDVAGINASIAGIIAMTSSFWSAGTDIAGGLKSDMSRNPQGRRRPFIFKWAVPLGISFTLLYTNFSWMSAGTKIIYFTVICFAYWMCLSFTDIPYMSFGAELSSDYKERTVIRSVANTLNYVGMILVSSGALVIVTFFSKSEKATDSMGWTKMAIAFGLIVLLGYWISAFATKGRDTFYVPKEGETSNINIKELLKSIIEVFKIKSLIPIILYVLFAYGSMMMFCATYVYYLVYVMGYDQVKIAYILLVYCIGVIVLSGVLGKIADKIEKKVLLMGFTLVYGIGLIVAQFLPMNDLGVCILFILYALGTAGFFIPSYAMVYDVCTVDEFDTGGGREGLILSAFYSTSKIGSGIAMFAAGAILSAAGYNSTAAIQTPPALAGIKMCTLLIPGVFNVIGALVLVKYPITKDRFNALKLALEKRAAGKEYSVEEFKEVL